MIAFMFFFFFLSRSTRRGAGKGRDQWTDCFSRNVGAEIRQCVNARPHFRQDVGEHRTTVAAAYAGRRVATLTQHLKQMPESWLLGRMGPHLVHGGSEHVAGFYLFYSYFLLQCVRPMLSPMISRKPYPADVSVLNYCSRVAPLGSNPHLGSEWVNIVCGNWSWIGFAQTKSCKDYYSISCDATDRKLQLK